MSTKLGKLLGTLFLSVGLMAAVSIGGCSSSTSTPPTDAGHDATGAAGKDGGGTAGKDGGEAGSDASTVDEKADTAAPDAGDAGDASDASDAAGEGG